MLCIDCKIDEATEFFTEFGRPVERGRCRACYERAIRRVVVDEKPVRGWATSVRRRGVRRTSG